MIVSTRTEVIVDINWTALADELEKKVMTKLQQDLIDWSHDRGMRAMFLSDASNGLEVCEKIVEGNWHQIEDRIWKMDTAAREYIYEWIAEIAGDDFFDLVR